MTGSTMATTTTTTEIPDTTTTENDESSNNIEIGHVFFKRFEDGNFYHGKVISGPEEVAQEQEDGSEQIVFSWRVRYEEDGEEEDLTAAEILEWPTEDPRGPAKKKARLLDKASSALEKAKMSLMWLPGMTEEEVTAALEKVGPPYGLQAVMNEIQETRHKVENYRSNNKFSPYVGMKVRIAVGGAQYLGEVTSDSRWLQVEDGTRVKMWEVTYEDDTKDDMDWYQLLQARADRPNRTHPCRGRPLYCLELFSGCGMVSQEFAERKWQVRSVDNSPYSNASDKVDVMKFGLRDIGFVPDFIWASPPCFTYSLMAGGKHRKVDTQEFEKTPEALEHNHIFAKMSQLLHESKALNPHLIVCVENPVGLLSKMPLMKELERSLGLYKTTVHYCAFGRSDKKPTHLWTNDFGLFATLNEFKCTPDRCPYSGGGVHPVSARQQGNRFNAAAIPDALAEEVAEYVNAKFVLDRIRHTAKPQVEEETRTVSSGSEE